MDKLDREKILEKLSYYKSHSQYRDKIKTIGLFGSYAKGGNIDKSDVDVFVKLEPLKMFDLIGIKNDLEKLLKKKVDIIALRNSMNSYLRNEIDQYGIYV